MGSTILDIGKELKGSPSFDKDRYIASLEKEVARFLRGIEFDTRNHQRMYREKQELRYRVLRLAAARAKALKQYWSALNMRYESLRWEAVERKLLEKSEKLNMFRSDEVFAENERLKRRVSELESLISGVMSEARDPEGREAAAPNGREYAYEAVGPAIAEALTDRYAGKRVEIHDSFYLGTHVPVEFTVAEEPCAVQPGGLPTLVMRTDTGKLYRISPYAQFRVVGHVREGEEG